MLDLKAYTKLKGLELILFLESGDDLPLISLSAPPLILSQCWGYMDELNKIRYELLIVAAHNQTQTLDPHIRLDFLSHAAEDH